MTSSRQPLTPSGRDQPVIGTPRATVRQSVGDVSQGAQGEQQLNTRLVQAASTAALSAQTTPLTASAQPVPQIGQIITMASLGPTGIAAGGRGTPNLHNLPLPIPATPDLLPPTVTRLERLTAVTLAGNLVPEVISSLRFADTCPRALLPWLAWARSVDWWELAESEDQSRALIRASFRLHQRKGTPWAIKEALTVLGFGDSTIIERATGRHYDGTLSYNGNENYGDPAGWAIYRVILARAVTTDQANRIKRLLAEMAPARCHLSALDYTRAPLSYNGAASYNGDYNHGAT